MVNAVRAYMTCSVRLLRGPPGILNERFDKTLHPPSTAFADDLAILAPPDLSVSLDILGNIADLPALASKA